MSQPPTGTSPNPHNPQRAAKQLLKAVQSGEPDALRRIRAIRRDMKGKSDTEVSQQTKLGHCQHVIAQELKAEDWSDLKERRIFRVCGTIGHVDVEALRVAAEREPAGSTVRRLMSDLFDPTKGYQALGTKKECDEVIAWSLRVHPPERRHPPRTVSIGSQTATLDLGALRIEPLGPPDDDPIDADFEYLSESDD